MVLWKNQIIGKFFNNNHLSTKILVTITCLVEQEYYKMHL